MNIFQYKLFNKDDNILAVERPFNVDYYSFLEEKFEEGYGQFIVTSDLMINVIAKFFVDKKAEIVSFELLEQDDVFNDKIESSLEELKRDRGYILDFIEQLKHLQNSNTIDVKKICLKYREGGDLNKFYLFINGLVEIERSDCHSDILKDIVSAILPGN